MSPGTPPCRLEGLCVFMSASVPSPERADQFRRIPDAAEQIEQAVVSLTRAVLSEGGRLVFGGHPAISPLVAMVAGEYRKPRYAESKEDRPRPNVRIYQSDLFRERIPESTLLMFQLGMADLVWTPKNPNESFDDGPAKGPRFRRSLDRMRDMMLRDEQPDAMVAIGGMEGVFDETRLFRDLFPGRPIYALRRTGGASALLSDEIGSHGLDFVDDRIVSEMLSRRDDGRPAEREDVAASGRNLRREAVEKEVLPYPLIMQTIVEELVERRWKGK